MNIHSLLLLICYSLTLILHHIGFRYDTKTNPLQSHIKEQLISISIHTILAFSITLRSIRIDSNILILFIASIIMGFVIFLLSLDYDDPYIYFFNGADLKTEFVMDFLKECLSKIGIPSDQYIIERKEYTKSEYQIVFRGINKKQSKQFITLCNSELESHPSLRFVNKWKLFCKYVIWLAVVTTIYGCMIFQPLSSSIIKL